MRHDGVHEQPGDTLSPMLRDHEHVADPRERRAIGHDTRETHLPATLIERGEAERPIEGALLDVSGHAGGPIRVVVKPAPDQFAIDVPLVARDGVVGHGAAV